MSEVAFLGVFIVILLIYYKLWTITTHWKQKGVPHEQPKMIWGNISDVIFKKKATGEHLSHLYSKFEGKRYFGVHFFLDPRIVLRDPNLIKEIVIKNFQTFPVHSVTLSEEADPLISQILIFMTDPEKWRLVRTTVSPAFTSSKIKTMFSLMNTCATHLVSYVEEKETFTFEMKSLFKKYATDIIGNCAVGLPCNTFQKTHNEFYKLANTTMANINTFRITLYNVFPALAKCFKLRLLKKKYADFWVNFVNNIITSRENGEYREDLLQLLLKAKNGELRNDSRSQPQYYLTNQDIAIQTLMVHLAGHDSTSAALTFACYELATNIDIQMELQQEIDALLEKCNGQPVSYENLIEMKYMDAVVSETLRKWPSVMFIDRKSKNDFTIKPNDANEKSLKLPVGSKIIIPVFAIHHDPKYYPDPEKFDPRRFYDGTKTTITPLTYIPFGLGPRSCLGNRFAMLQVKIMLFHILSKFSITPVKNTPFPMTVTGHFLLEPSKECWLDLKPRKTWINEI